MPSDKVMLEEAYFVVTDDSCPIKIHFSMEQAIKEKENYIDSFDSRGRLVKTYEKTDKNEYVIFADHLTDSLSDKRK